MKGWGAKPEKCHPGQNETMTITSELMVCFVCCCFTSQQHLWSYQYGYRLVTLRIHDDFIVQHHDLISHSVKLSWYWANQSLPYPSNAKHLARKGQGSIWCHCFDSTMGSNPRSPARETSALPIRPLRPFWFWAEAAIIQIINLHVKNYFQIPSFFLWQNLSYPLHNERKVCCI